MPLQTVSYRPQTSKQAKKAYQKAGASPRISAQEKRRIERTAELEARADRIRIHNLRARENKRKKAERLQREREARQRMGIPEPVKESVGPSQLRLGAFVTAKGRLKKEKDDCDFSLSPPEEFFKDEDCTDCDTILKLDCPEEPVAAPMRTRTPPPALPIPTPNLARANTSLTEDAKRKSVFTTPQTLQVAPTRTLPKEISERKSLFATSQTSRPAPFETLSKENVKRKPMPPASLMPPPPRPLPKVLPRQKLSSPVVTHQIKASGVALTDNIEPDWATFFTSNTQVEREISEYQQKPLLPIPCPIESYKTSSDPPIAITDDFLAGICTQDLQYSSSPPTPPKQSGDVTALPESDRTASTRSFDEFDDDELSSQDFCDLDV
ncbi:MAG: hypothetical protein Q9218_005491 [Villophora microphyllina]